MTYRNLVNRAVGYMTSRRDSQITAEGILAKFAVPETSAEQLEFYSDPVSGLRKLVFYPCIPLYRAYYDMINITGTSIENELPLQIIVRSQDYIPIDTIIYLPQNAVQDNLPMTVTFWRVLDTQFKHVESIASRIAEAVPARDGNWDNNPIWNKKPIVNAA